MKLLALVSFPGTIPSKKVPHTFIHGTFGREREERGEREAEGLTSWVASQGRSQALQRSEPSSPTHRSRKQRGVVGGGPRGGGGEGPGTSGNVPLESWLSLTAHLCSHGSQEG